MTTVRFELSNPKIAVARRTFDENHLKSPTSACALSFKQLFDLFIDESLTITEIARKAGITRQSTNALYDRYFCELLGHVLPSERYAALLKARQDTRRETMAETMIQLSWFEEVNAGAESIRLSLRPCIAVDKNGKLGKPSKRSVYIGDTFCHVHPVATARKLSPRVNMRYGVVRLKTDTFDALHLFPVVIPKLGLGTFVIPGSVLRNALVENDGETVLLYIPLRRGKRESRGRIDCWPYLNNWRLLLQ